MTYEVRVARQAELYLRRLDHSTRDRILARLDQIAENPFGLNTKPLTNSAGLRSSRVGGYRIVFSVDVSAQIVDVSVIGPRGGAYRSV
jgi:mRNA interferase RelE/StbE